MSTWKNTVLHRFSTRINKTRVFLGGGERYSISELAVSSALCYDSDAVEIAFPKIPAVNDQHRVKFKKNEVT